MEITSLSKKLKSFIIEIFFLLNIDVIGKTPKKYLNFQAFQEIEQLKRKNKAFKQLKYDRFHRAIDWHVFCWDPGPTTSTGLSLDPSDFTHSAT